MQIMSTYWPISLIAGLLMFSPPPFSHAQDGTLGEKDTIVIAPQVRAENQDNELKQTPVPGKRANNLQYGNQDEKQQTPANKNTQANPPGSPTYERDMQQRFSTTEQPGETPSEKSKHVGS